MEVTSTNTFKELQGIIRKIKRLRKLSEAFEIQSMNNSACLWTGALALPGVWSLNLYQR